MTETDPKAALDLYFQNLAWLRLEWELFRSLFGSSPQQIEALNVRTGMVFRVFQDRLYDHMVLSVGRLLDPMKTGSGRNLSLAGLAAELGLEEPLRGRISQELSRLRSRFRDLRSVRDKRIAHLDRDVAIGGARLDEATRADLAVVIDEIDRIHNLIRNAYDGSQVCLVGLDRDAKREVATLINVLDRGNTQLDFEARERRQRFIDKYGADGIDEHFDPGEDAPDL